MADIGDKFRAAREARGVGIDRVAQETKISGRFLQAIERGEFDSLPGGIYTRGFIRTYAAVLGLNPAEAVSEFEKTAGRQDQELIVRNAADRRQSADRNLYVGAAGALIGLIVLFYVFSGKPTGNTSVIRQPEPAAKSPSQAVAAAAVAEVPEAKPIEERPAAPALTIEMHVIERTWVSLHVDGRDIVNSEILEPGTSRTYTAHTSIQLRVGNAAGLVLKVNERELPALGKAGQVREIEFTPDTVKTCCSGGL